jgi:hypothetical protein
METLENIIAEKNRLTVLEKKMKQAKFLEDFKTMNIVLDEKGDVVSFDAYTWNSQSRDVYKFETDDSGLVSIFSSEREYASTRVRITFFKNEKDLNK